MSDDTRDDTSFLYFDDDNGHVQIVSSSATTSLASRKDRRKVKDRHYVAFPECRR